MGRPKRGMAKARKATKAPPPQQAGGVATPKSAATKEIKNFGQLPVRLKEHCAGYHAGKCKLTAEECLAATKRKHDPKLPRADKATLRAVYKIEAKRKEDRSASRSHKDSKGEGKGAASRESTPQRRTNDSKPRYACQKFMDDGKCDFPNCKFLHVDRDEAIRSNLLPPSPKAAGKGAKAAAAALADEAPAAPALLCDDSSSSSDEELPPLESLTCPVRDIEDDEPDGDESVSEESGGSYTPQAFDAWWAKMGAVGQRLRKISRAAVLRL